jgi:uncharacterized membrane protein
MGLMRFLEAHFPNLAAVLEHDALWLVWNTFLAWIPVGLALLLFSSPGRRRTYSWWAGAVLFVLFLPNAPYVLTDLVHLRDDMRLVSTTAAPLTVYAVFITSGFVAYYLSLKLLGRYLAENGLARWRPGIVVGVHALCAIGVFLGRHARLNSWEPIVEPRGTFERVVLTLSWRYTPVLVVATFVATWVGHFVTKAVLETAWRTAGEPVVEAVARKTKQIAVF